MKKIYVVVYHLRNNFQEKESIDFYINYDYLKLIDPMFKYELNLIPELSNYLYCYKEVGYFEYDDQCKINTFDYDFWHDEIIKEEYTVTNVYDLKNGDYKDE